MSLIQDIRFALRTIRKRPTTSLVILLTLGLGIGANATFFAGFHGMVLNPLPFEEPERLVALHESQPALGETWNAVSAANLADWLDSGEVLTGAGAYRWANYNFQSSEEPVRILGSAVSANLFPLLGVEPHLGRHFLPSEDLPGGALVALLGYDLWQERFESDPVIVGKTVRLDDEIHEIVGVMPAGFEFQNNGRLWTTLGADPLAEPRGDRRLTVVARLAGGVGVSGAQAALSTVADRLAERHPDTNRGWSVKVRPLRDAWLPPVTRLAAAAQLVLVGGVLLIVCANVTNIVLAQATARRQEKALRSVLGASRRRLVRQSLIESIVLALGGGVVGALLGAWSESWIRDLAAVPVPYWLRLDMNAPTLVFTVAVTLSAGVLIGLLPSLKSTGTDLFESLKSGGRTNDRSGGALRQGLVVLEYALALVILVAGLLMAKSFANLRAADSGFATEDVLTLRVPLTGRAYDDPAARTAYLEEALRRLEALSETAAVGAASALPISQNGHATAGLGVEGRDVPEGEEPRVTVQRISERYLEALDIPLVAGRQLTAAEVRDGGRVVLLSRTLAEELWSGEDTLGRRVRTVGQESGPWLEVAGIVGDVRPGQMLAGLDMYPRHQVYLPLAGVLGAPRLPSLVLRSRGEPAAMVPAVRAALGRLDPNVPLFQVLTMDEVLRRFYFAQHIWSRMFSAIAVLALLIAAVGAYGVTAYSVSRRMREMGVRIALGASPLRLLAFVVRQGFVLAAVGVGLGIAGAVPLARAMQSLLHDMRAIDPIVFSAVAGVLLTVGVVASYVPARRAAGVDPIVVLRNE